MITKLDNPIRNSSEELKYTNTGTVSKLKNYLVANEEKISSGELFFNDKYNNMSANQFYNLIDHNVKGLTDEDQKFYSFTLNPSEKEIQHIGNDYYKFREFVIDTMKENYSEVFSKKKQVQKDDLVWAAIIHEKRFYTQQDYNKHKSSFKREPGFKVGQEKPFSMHAHIVVSARNTGQTKSLTVLTRKYRLSRDFNLKKLQGINQHLFQQKFFYEQGRNIYEEGQLKILNQKIKVVERYAPNIDADKIRGIAKVMNYEAKFDKFFNQLTYLSKQGVEVQNLDLFFENGLYKTQSESPLNLQTKSYDGVGTISKILGSVGSGMVHGFVDFLAMIPIVPEKDYPEVYLQKKKKKGFGFGHRM